MGKIYETEHGTFRVRWYDQHGKQHSKTLKTRSQAGTFLKKAEGKVAEGTFISPQEGKISLESWIDRCRSTDFNLEDSTKETESRAAKRVNDQLGNLLLSNLRRQDVEDYIARRLESGASPGYVAMEFRVLRKWLNRAVATGIIPHSPCKGVQAPKGEAAEMRFLNAQELIALAGAMPERYWAWVLTLGVGGLRFSEANGLRRRNVRLDDQRADVVEQLVFDRATKAFVRKTTLKTRSSRRTVTLGSWLTGELKKHLDTYSLPGDDGRVFPTRDGAPLGQSSTNAMFKRALKRAGLPTEVRIHDLRHTAVALAIAEGAHPTAIQRRMGHSSITVTLGTYGHLFPELDVELADRLDITMRAAHQPPQEDEKLQNPS